MGQFLGVDGALKNSEYFSRLFAIIWFESILCPLIQTGRVPPKQLAT